MVKKQVGYGILPEYHWHECAPKKTNGYWIHVRDCFFKQLLMPASLEEKFLHVFISKGFDLKKAVERKFSF